MLNSKCSHLKAGGMLCLSFVTVFLSSKSLKRRLFKYLEAAEHIHGYTKNSRSLDVCQFCTIACVLIILNKRGVMLKIAQMYRFLKYFVCVNNLSQLSCGAFSLLFTAVR